MLMSDARMILGVVAGILGLVAIVEGVVYFIASQSGQSISSNG
jgi:uncharacterized protein YjeT (DUF2065 family)